MAPGRDRSEDVPVAITEGGAIRIVDLLAFDSGTRNSQGCGAICQGKALRYQVVEKGLCA